MQTFAQMRIGTQSRAPSNFFITETEGFEITKNMSCVVTPQDRKHEVSRVIKPSKKPIFTLKQTHILLIFSQYGAQCPLLVP